MPRYSDYEKYTDQEIRDKIKDLCLDRRTPSETRRSIMKALKDHSFISSLPPGEARGLLEELHLRVTPRKEELRHDVKTALPPLPSKHSRWNWGGNAESLCQQMTFSWAISLTLQPSSGKHPKADFYEASSTNVRPRILVYPLTPFEQTTRTSAWHNALKERNLLPSWVGSNEFWTCENTLGYLQLLRIHYFLYEDFFNEIYKLVEKLPSYEIDGFIIFASSVQLNHAVGLSITQNSLYFKLRFFDPNSLSVELVVALSRSDRSEWIEKIHGLITSSGGLGANNKTDFTFFVFAMDANSRIPRTQTIRTNSDKEIASLSFNDRLSFIRSILIAGGGRGPYLGLFKRLWHVPPAIPAPDLTAPLKGGNTLPSMAALFGYDEIFNEFLNCNLPAPSLLQPRPVDGLTPMTLAAMYNHSNIVKLLINCRWLEPALLLQPCTGGSTPLSVAARGGHNEVVRTLVNSTRLSPDLLLQTPANLPTPLFLAAKFAHTEVIRTLIYSPRLPPNLLLQAWNGRTPLEVARRKNLPHDIIQRLEELQRTLSL